MNTTAPYRQFQAGYDRVAQAAVGAADQVPIFVQLCECIPRQMGVSARDAFHDPECIVHGTLEICRRFDIDVPAVDYDAYNIEAEAIGQQIIFDDHVMPDVDRSHPLIQSRSDLKRLTTPDFDRAGRCAMVVETYRQFERLTGIAPGVWFCAPFSLAANIRGISDLIMDICLNPEFARDLFDFITDDLLIPWIAYLTEHLPNAPSIAGADAMASLPVINEKIMAEWIVPYIEKLRHAFGPGLIVPNHTGERFSASPERFMDMRRRANPKFIEGQDPDVAKLGPEFYKQYAQKHDLPLLLGLGAAFLNNATPDDINRRVKHYIEVGNQNGRLWFYLCNLSPSTPDANIQAAVQAVHQFGKIR